MALPFLAPSIAAAGQRGVEPTHGGVNEAAAVPQVAGRPARAPRDTAEAKTAAKRTRFYVGMWSTHLRDIDHGLSANSLFGFAYRGFFGGTFINSFGDRSVTAGLQRSFSEPASGALTTAFGYRLGVVTGYDERFFGIGDKLPVLPFVQLVGSVDWRSIGVEIGYAGIVASIMTSWRF